MDPAAVAVAAQHLRTVLAEIDAGELDCSPTYRLLLEGAVLALESVSGSGTPSDR